VARVIERFPLFPLGLVLLPSEVVPLHIFEDRYKEMIGHCLEGDEEFGVVWLSDGGLREIGCSAVITEVLEEMDDGRLNILVRGSTPFRLLRRIDDLPYPAGDIEPLDEAPGEVDDAEAAEAHERYADLVDRATDSRPEPADLAGMTAFGMAGTIDFGLEDKQGLLEIRSERERLKAVRALFDTAIRKLDYADRAGERAKSNGRIRF
jgi:Lon protease-like protein